MTQDLVLYLHDRIPSIKRIQPFSKRESGPTFIKINVAGTGQNTRIRHNFTLKMMICNGALLYGFFFKSWISYY